MVRQAHHEDEHKLTMRIDSLKKLDLILVTVEGWSQDFRLFQHPAGGIPPGLT
jgi:hypothetical protein